MPTIAQVDMDTAKYIGDEQDGVYFTSARGKEGWYASAIVDCNTGHFCGDAILSDDGPYKTKLDADRAGRRAAEEWCMTNDVNWVFEPHTLKVGGCEVQSPRVCRTCRKPFPDSHVGHNVTVDEWYCSPKCYPPWSER